MMKIKSISGNLTEISMMFDLIEKLYVKDGVVAHRYNFENASPVMLLSNCDDLNFDVITLSEKLLWRCQHMLRSQVCLYLP